MLKFFVTKQLEAAREQFRLSSSQLEESVSGYRPAEEMMTVAQHVAHAAQVIDWLREGAFSAEGFDLDFDPQIARVMATTSLREAQRWFEESISHSIEKFGALEDADLLRLLPDGPVMGGLPRLMVPAAIAEHTSHHRGALAVYARMKGIRPSSPYGM